jgi:tetratricopeptide (TPR) repeat protein
MEYIGIMAHLRNLLMKGKNGEALQHYLKNVKEYGHEPDLRNLGGDIFARLGKVDEALIEYERSCDLYREKDLLANAIAICKKALRIDPAYDHVYAALGDIYMQSGLIGESILNYLEYAERIRKNSGRSKLDVTFKKMQNLFGENNRILMQTIEGFPELAREFRSYRQAVQSVQELQKMDLIETLKRDPEYRTFERLVEMEFYRSKRYLRQFSIFSIELQFSESVEHIANMERLFGILKNNLRTIDYLFLNTEGFFYGLLPETPSDGVFILSDRLVTRVKELCQGKANVSMRWATYPKDGQSLQALLESLQKSGQVYFH